jgi:thiol-disulfide isomerase/thioredoxin
MKRRAILFLFLLAISAVTRAEEPGRTRARQVPLRLIDEQGQPVVGADVGYHADSGSYFVERAKSEGTQWLYQWHRRSDAKGIVSVDDRRIQGQLSIIARHEQREISAMIGHVDPDKTKLPIVLTLRPEQTITGQALCPEIRHDVKVLVVDVDIEGHRILTTVHNSADFELALPPGKYELRVRGLHTHTTQQTIEVTTDTNPLRLEPITLQATRLALIEGQPAPEISDVVAWKNSPSLKLADLRGKCVIVEFWGYWCSACVLGMPKIFALYDEYHDQGLEVIGIHIDKGESEQTPVATVAELDKRLAQIRKETWSGRDLPFPTALVLGKPTPYGERTDQQAISATSAAFGVIGYPTRILIDRAGRVVGNFNPNDEGMEFLKQKLTEKY